MGSELCGEWDGAVVWQMGNAAGFGLGESTPGLGRLIA